MIRKDTQSPPPEVPGLAELHAEAGQLGGALVEAGGRGEAGNHPGVRQPLHDVHLPHPRLLVSEIYFLRHTKNILLFSAKDLVVRVMSEPSLHFLRARHWPVARWRHTCTMPKPPEPS